MFYQIEVIIFSNLFSSFAFDYKANKTTLIGSPSCSVLASDVDLSELFKFIPCFCGFSSVETTSRTQDRILPHAEIEHNHKESSLS